MIEYIRYDDDKIQAWLDDTEEDAILTIAKIDAKNRKNFHQKVRESYEGLADCNMMQDKYDEDLGKRIAKDRLLIKYYDDKCHDYLSYANYVQGVLDDIMKVYCKAFNTRANYVEDLQSLGLER